MHFNGSNKILQQEEIRGKGDLNVPCILFTVMFITVLLIIFTRVLISTHLTKRVF